MPRTKQIPELPPLRLLFPKECVADAKKGALVRKFAGLLRESFRPLQDERALLVHGSRELAAYFKIHQTTVVRAMALLEKEGLLMRVRGAGTFLRSKRAKPRSGVKGIVGFPVWQYAYCMLGEWRLFYDQMEDQLRQHNFVANLIFFKGPEHQQLVMTEKLLDHKLDHLVWYRPLPEYLSIMRSLSDSGVDIRVIDDRGTPYPFPTYQLDPFGRLLSRLRQWKKNGVKKWQILIEAAYSAEFERRMKSSLCGMDLEFEMLKIDCVHKKYPPLEDLQKTLAGIILHESMATLYMHRHGRAKFVKILKGRPVIALHHLDMGTDGWDAGGRMDLLSYQWAKLADIISRDMATGRTSKKLTVIEPHLTKQTSSAHVTLCM